jgi:hypothetical protein
MENRLNEILTTINGYYHYGDDMVHQYISLINEAIEIMCEFKAPPASMLEYAKNDAQTELSNELANRLNEGFFNSPIERRKSEFKISKMLVGVAIGNVLSNMTIVKNQLLQSPDNDHNELHLEE